MIANRPFFIIGCVRSGTTMLRDILRMHPNLAAPEETHFYRWPDPFGTRLSVRQLQQNKVLSRHRAIDGIEQEEFVSMLHSATTRRQLYELYMQRYIEKNKPQARRWFDKTPQNVYGAAMLAADFPGSRFVHIVRNPVDVVISLRLGHVMKIEALVGACNYWREAAAIIRTLKRAAPRRIHEIRYEDFTSDPAHHTGKILDFLEEEYQPSFMDAFESRPPAYERSRILGVDDMRTIREICGKLAGEYGYSL